VSSRPLLKSAAVVLALVSFISTSVVARYIEGRGE